MFAGQIQKDRLTDIQSHRHSAGFDPGPKALWSPTSYEKATSSSMISGHVCCVLSPSVPSLLTH